MRVLITGGAGLVARHMVAAAPADAELHLTWRHAAPPRGAVAHRVELTDAAAVRAMVDDVEPDVIVHTAYSQRDRDDIVVATEHVAAAASAAGAQLLHLSTDVVFDGTDAPYVESDPVSPVNDYGRWKAMAESVAVAAVPDVCITRSSLVVALDPPDPATRALFAAVTAGERPTLFHDEVRCPIRAVDLADTMWALIRTDRAQRSGIWHLPGPEALTRLELGRRLLAVTGLDPDAAVAGSARAHPEPRPPDLTLRSTRAVPGPPPRPVDAPPE